MGQTLLITGDGLPAKVTGVMKDIPENSLIKGDVVLSMSTITQKFNAGLDSQWGNYGASAYLLLKPNTNPKALEKKFPAFLNRRNGTEMKQLQMFPTLFLEPLRSVYLYSTRGDSKTGNINNVYIFSIIAIFILLIACINFINLTTARSAERAKEVGIRKVVGSCLRGGHRGSRRSRCSRHRPSRCRGCCRAGCSRRRHRRRPRRRRGCCRGCRRGRRRPRTAPVAEQAPRHRRPCLRAACHVGQHDRRQDREQFLDQATAARAGSGECRCDGVAVISAEEGRDEVVALLRVDLIDVHPAVEQIALALFGDCRLELA